MRIVNFLANLSGAFRKDDLVERLDLCKQGLDEETLPAYENAALNAYFEGRGFKSQAARDFETAFQRSVKTRFRGGLFEVSLSILKNLSVSLGHLEAFADKSFSGSIVIEGISYPKAVVLQYMSSADFVVDYARRNLLYLLAAEANEVSKEFPAGKVRPVPELDWLKANREPFFQLMELFSKEPRELDQALKSIPDVNVDATRTAEIEQTIGVTKLDPLKFNLVDPLVRWNPFFMVGMAWSNYKLVRLDRAKADKRALEFRLEQLRLQRAGRSDAQLEKSISVYEDEANALAEKIAKLTR